MKFIKSIVFILFFSVLFVGCIRNDIPFPVIKGEVLVFEAEGQAAEPVIDLEKRVIRLTLLDTVDIRKVQIFKYNFTAEATSTLDSGAVLDLRKPYEFEITTYQTYKWRIETVQPINRAIKISGQIGAAIVDVENCKVIINVAKDQDLYNIQVDSMQLGPSICTVSPNPLDIVNFSAPQTFMVSYFDIQEEWTVFVFPSNESVSMGAINAWAKFADLQGSIVAGSADESGFEVSEDGVAWVKVPDVVVEGGKISARAKGLKAATTYKVRAFLGAEVSQEVSFTTEEMVAIPNLSFDEGYKEGKNWYFNATGGNSFWATGNKGVTGAPLPNLESNTIQVDDAVKGKAVKMTSWGGIALVGHAAGNLFTGDFITNMNSPKDSPKFGRPYVGRPVGMKGWYKYKSTPITVNVGKPGSGDDECHIYISLENWGDKTLRPAVPDVVGYGEFHTAENVSTYTEFSFNIDYKKKDVKPTHIVLTATSSIYGGVFCGGNGSELFVDEFELIWE